MNENHNLAAISKELRTLKNRRNIIKAILEDLDDRISQAEAQIEEQMTTAGIEKIVADNTEFSLKETISASIIKDRIPDLVIAAKANGCGELVKTSINTNSLSAYLRKYVRDNNGLIPDWVDGFVNLKVRTKLIVKDM